MKLNKDSVARLALPSGKKDHIEFDGEVPGFGVRLRAGGKRTWIFQYRVGAKQRRLKLGVVGALDADKARATAKKKHAEVELGGDPQADKVKERADAHVTALAVVKDYLAFKNDKLKPKGLKEQKRYLETGYYWKPLHGLQIAKVTRSDVAAQLRKIAAKSGGYAANRAKAALSAMYSWAMKEGLCGDDPTNPVANTNKQAQEARRTRVVNDRELAEIWDAALSAGEYGRIVQLLMLTGQRREEIGGLRLPEIDLGNWDDDLGKRLITLPPQRTKNQLPHEIPLSDSAIHILKKCPRRERREFLFGSRKGPFTVYAKAKAALDAAIMEARTEQLGEAAPPLVPWQLRDLRRTLSTKMGEDLGVQPHVVEAILNHVSGEAKRGVAGVYNHAIYRKEKAQALTHWADHVASIVAGGTSNIRPLRKPAQDRP
jgi:integrase